MLEQAKTPKKKRGWLWLSVGVIAFALLITPVIRSFYLQSKAGKLIRDYVDRLEASTTNSIKGNFYCLLPSLYEMPKSDELDDAIELLMAASHRFPENGHINLLLGQAYCLKQDYKQAMYWYEKGAVALEPHAMNNLGALYERGLGVTKDQKKAEYWYAKAREALESQPFLESLEAENN